MKILHAAETYRGGIATIVNQLILDQLNRDGCQVALVLPVDHVEDVVVRPGLLNFPYERRERGIRSLLSFSRRIYAAYREFKPDVIHLHSTFAGACCRLILLPQILKREVKVVYCPHGWSFLMRCGENAKKVRILTERVLAKFCDRIVCISDHEYEEAADVGLPADRLYVVKNAIPYRELPSTSLVSPAVHKLNLLFVGRFDEQKGFDILFSALERLKGKPIQLVAVGAPVVGSAQYSDTENIRFTGWLRPDQIDEYYTSADLLVMPSRWEGFGLTALEAMSFGTPVLASRVGGLKEIVRSGINGELCEPSIEDLVRILGETPHQHWRSLRDGARKTAVHDFSSKKMTDAVFSIYSAILRA